MESQASSDISDDAKEFSPASPLQTKLSMTSASVSDEILTPEKRINLPWRASKKGLSFVNGMGRIAMGTRSQVANPLYFPQFDVGLPQKLRSCSDSAPAFSLARNLTKLQENYEILGEFFNCLDSSIRLLRLKRVCSTFTNISSSIQHLTDRRFTYRHLAQLKHILPESISVKKVLLHDETTCCMKPELLVSLQADALDRKVAIKGGNAYTALRKVFRARLVQFAQEHPEDDEIPEDTLPYPFGWRKPNVSTESNESAPSILTGSISAVGPTKNITPISHFSGSFQRRFSQRTPFSNGIKSHLISLNDVDIKYNSLIPSSPPKVSIHKKSPLCSPVKRSLSSYKKDFEEDPKMLINFHSSSSKGKLSLESTPVKEVSTLTRLIITTPDLQAPKRSKSTIEDSPSKQHVKRTTKTRLFTSPRKDVYSETDMSDNSSAEDDVLSFLPESLLRDIKEKERKTMEEKETNASRARLRKKIIASLPQLLNSILLIFQSGNRPVITKQELVHKVLGSHCSIVDRNEVEEQLELMQELVPDWISQKVTVSGDILYRLNKISCTQEIRRRLAVAE